jgi:dihydrofolate synthase/folylpolyglutamate synthase
MSNQDFNQVIEVELMSFLTQHFGFEVFTPGLDRTFPVYESFIKYFKKIGTKVVIVAGTNGKGQTAHTLSSFLNWEKRKVALWTSPHILSLRERFIFSSEGQLVESSYKELQMAMTEGMHHLLEELKGVKVSFYEFLFLVFLILAKNKGDLDYLVLEVGLGGRLDAVNHFDADCACITSISRDHQSILGERYSSILHEKIAVSREKRPLYTNFELEYLNSLTNEYVNKHNIDWHKLQPNKKPSNYFEENQEMAWEIFRFFIPNSKLNFEQGKELLPLYKGRREMMTFNGKSLIFIGAHNIDGVRKMLQSYLESSDLIFPESLLVSFSQRPLNEVEVMLKSLMEFFKDKASLTLTSFDHPKALSEKSIREASLKVNKGMLNFVFDWKSELKDSKAKTILVCGSYYFIGEVQRFINS